VGSCITPGLPLTNVSYLAVSDNGVESLFLKRTKSRKVNQTSLPVLQAWRGNIDIQLIHYKSDPRHPNYKEIQGVIHYIVSYVTKKGYRFREEQKMMEDIILRSVLLLVYLILLYFDVHLWLNIIFISVPIKAQFKDSVQS
jgi:hypothetical protein